MEPVLWKRLPNFIKDSGNVDKFKKKLKTFLFTVKLEHISKFSNTEYILLT